MQFFLNFIPTVGLLVAVLLPLPLIYLAPPEVTTTHRVLAFLIPYGLQVVVTNVVEPLVFGDPHEHNIAGTWLRRSNDQWIK